MDDIKRCERCGAIISDVNASDWYSHIRIKYCDQCREKMNKKNTAERAKAYRKRKQEEHAELLSRCKALETENELLRLQINSLRDFIERSKIK